MTDEKQIEEMAKSIAKEASECSFRLCQDCKYHKKDKLGKTSCQAIMIAEQLYEQGYRKLTPNAVVLSKEEYEKLKGRAEEVFNEMNERMKAEIKIERKMGNRKVEQARKETAREFVKSFTFVDFMAYSNGNGELYWVDFLVWLDELAKQFGVE